MERYRLALAKKRLVEDGTTVNPYDPYSKPVRTDGVSVGRMILWRGSRPPTEELVLRLGRVNNFRVLSVPFADGESPMNLVTEKWGGFGKTWEEVGRFAVIAATPIETAEIANCSVVPMFRKSAPGPPNGPNNVA